MLGDQVWLINLFFALNSTKKRKSVKIEKSIFYSNWRWGYSQNLLSLLFGWNQQSLHQASSVDFAGVDFWKRDPFLHFSVFWCLQNPEFSRFRDLENLADLFSRGQSLLDSSRIRILSKIWGLLYQPACDKSGSQCWMDTKQLFV